MVMDEYFAVNNGMSISAQRFRAELTAKGQEVAVLANSVSGRPEFPLPEFRMPVFDPLIKRQGFRFAKADTAVIEEAVRWADIVHLEDPFLVSAKAARIAKKLGKPCTATFHLYPENIFSSIHLGWCEPLNAGLMRIFRNYVYRFADDIICPDEKVRRRLLQYHYTSDLHVISNGIPDSFTIRREAKPPRLAGHFVILCIGRYSVEKNQILLIEAVRRSRYADRIQLVFAGQGPLAAFYRKRAAKLPLPPVFRFYTQEELRQVMDCADLYVHCALAEVEGMSCLEAIACGVVPLIMDTPKSSTRKFALDGRSLFRSGSLTDLRDKIDFWIEHPALREELAAAYHRLAAGYSISVSADQMLAVMQAAAERKDSGGNNEKA